MATMYVFNIPSNETVNLRSKPNGTVLIRVGYGKAVEASPSSESGWHNAAYGGKTGYIMTKFLTPNDPNLGGGGSDDSTFPIAATVDTTKHGNGGTVNIRNNPWGTAGKVIDVKNGSAIKVNNKTGTWIRVKVGSTTGYIMAKFVQGTVGYNRNYNSNTASGSQGTYYIGNRYLSDYGSEMTANARYIYNYCTAKGWTKNAICAMLGNIQVESKINPGLWQGRKENNDSGGYGLTQWTSAKSKILTYACDKQRQIDDIDVQLMRLSEEMSTSHSFGQWMPKQSWYDSYSVQSIDYECQRSIRRLL